MRRIVLGCASACAVAAFITACGSGTSPSPPPIGGGNPGGGPPPVNNSPPQITSITVSDTRVEVGTPITLTAVVEDAETPVANLTYEWTADTGTFTGTGAVVTWSPGSEAKTPADYVVTLTVTERYTSGSTPAENKASGTTTAHVNNSPKELAELSLRFLGDFADSKVSPDKCVSEFSASCGRDKQDEFNDITDNRHDFLHVASTLRHTGLSIAADRKTATVHTFGSITSRVITTTPQSDGCTREPGACPFNGMGTAEGDFWTTNVYEQGRWWLCASHYTPTGSLTAFARAFIGNRRIEIP
jgi:hypothetical protein